MSILIADAVPFFEVFDDISNASRLVTILACVFIAFLIITVAILALLRKKTGTKKDKDYIELR